MKNPFKQFADKRILKRSKEISMIKINRKIFKKPTAEDITQVVQICDTKLDEYYERLRNRE